MSSLCQLLLDRSIATLHQVDAVLASQAHRGGAIGLELLAMDVVTETQLHELLSEIHELPSGPSSGPLLLDAAACALVPGATARAMHIVPLERRDGALMVATSHPLTGDNERLLVDRVGMSIRCVLVSELRIQQALSSYFEGPVLDSRSLALLARLDGDDVALDEQPPSSGAVSSRPGPPSSDGSLPGDWLPPSTRPSPDASEAPPSSGRGADGVAHFRHRGPLSRVDGQRALERASDVRFVLEVLVRYVRQYVDCCVLFVVRRGLATPRHAHGWTMEPLKIDLSEPGSLSEANGRGSGGLTRLGADGSDGDLRSRIGIGDDQVLIVPLTIRGRTVAILLGADEGADVESEAASELCSFAYEVAAALARIILENKREG